MDVRQYFLKNLAQTSDFPLALHFVKAKGCYLYDTDNQPYLDLISGIGVSNIGHSNQQVIQAIRQQSEAYLYQMVYGEFIQSPQVQLAKALCETLAHLSTPNGQLLDNVYFTNSGAEAVEGALKLARRFTGRPEIVACKNSYHGSTTGALALGEEHFQKAFRPLMPGIRKICRNRFEDLEQITEKTAAIIIEPIGAESGVYETELEFMTTLKDRCQSTGTLLIFDEIQTGFGRTGTFWATEHYGFVPDILLSAKALGGGLPLGAFIASQFIMSSLKTNPILGHITTFGGNPLSCAASLATLNFIKDRIDFKQVNHVADQLKALLKNKGGFSEVRGKGMMMAAQMSNFEQLQNLIKKLIKKGVITDWFLYNDSSMRIAPPLIFGEEELKYLEARL